MSGEGGEEAGRFVVLAAPRTGSNWLCSMLDSHPAILCHHEIFNPERIIYAVSLRVGELDLGSVAARDRCPGAVIERLWQASFGHRWVGFKLNRGQHPEAFRQVLDDRSVRKIVIKRRNRIKLFVSEQLALRTGEWESYPWSQRQAEKPKLRVSVEDDLRPHMAKNEDYYRRLEAALEARGERWLEVTYEDLPKAEERARLLAFLDLEEPQGGLSGMTRKQGKRDLRAMIANFDELATELAGSDLEAELHDRGL